MSPFIKSLSNAYGLTLGRNRRPQNVTTSHHFTGSTPDIRGLALDNLRTSSSIQSDILITKLREENELLKKEASIKEAKLQSNIRSIRTFWSPELKKERNSRKEHESRSKRLESELRDMQGTIPENMLQRENLVLRRAVQDLEGNFSKCTSLELIEDMEDIFLSACVYSRNTFPPRAFRSRGTQIVFFISLFMSI